MQSPIAWDADEPKFDGGPETHAFRDEAFAEAMRKPSNPPPSPPTQHKAIDIQMSPLLLCMPGGLGFCLCLFCPWDRSTDAGDQKYSGVEALIFFSPNEGGKRQGLTPRLSRPAFRAGLFRHRLPFDLLRFEASSVRERVPV